MTEPMEKVRQRIERRLVGAHMAVDELRKLDPNDPRIEGHAKGYIRGLREALHLIGEEFE